MLVCRRMIDLSNLSPEKRAFLKAHPDLLKSLEKEIPNQIRRVNTRKKKLSKGKSKLQRDLEDVYRIVEEAKRKADKLRREYMIDPHLRKIQENFNSKLGVIKGENSLVCPECGEGDHGNRMNKQPWCMKCNTALVTKKMLKKWLKLPKIKAVRKADAIKNELNRLNPGLNPDNKEEAA